MRRSSSSSSAPLLSQGPVCVLMCVRTLLPKMAGTTAPVYVKMLSSYDSFFIIDTLWQWLVLAITSANATTPAIDEHIAICLPVLKESNDSASPEVVRGDIGTSVTGNVGLLNACMKLEKLQFGTQ